MDDEWIIPYTIVMNLLMVGWGFLIDGVNVLERYPQAMIVMNIPIMYLIGRKILSYIT